MNPREIFCPNRDCPARGQTGKGNIHVHSRKDERYCCTVCGQTFTTSQGTIFYRLRTDPQIVMWVVVLLAYGCPVQAIVKTFELDERTVSDWYERAGNHCQRVHEHQVENRSQDLQQVQADEIKVKALKGTYWMALAMAVGTRLWLGGVVQPQTGSGSDPGVGGQGAGDGPVSALAAGRGWPGQLCDCFSPGFPQPAAPLARRNGSSPPGFLGKYCHCSGRQAAY